MKRDFKKIKLLLFDSKYITKYRLQAILCIHALAIVMLDNNRYISLLRKSDVIAIFR